MARIPLGDFGNAILKPGPQVQQVAVAFDNGGAALADLGDAGYRSGMNILAAQRAEAEKQKRENEALARARAADAALTREEQTRTLADDVAKRLESGDLTYDTALTEYDKAASMLETPEIGSLDPVTKSNYERGLKRIGMQTRLTVARAAEGAKKIEFRSRVDSAMDKIGKQASLPGADVNALSGQVALLEETGQYAYGKEWAKKKQDWTDANWNAHLNQKTLEVRDNLPGIKALEKDITQGQYADKLDSDRRNTLMLRLDGYRNSILQRNEMAAQRAERERERYLNRAEAEFNTFQALADKGTVIAPDYVDRVARLTAGTPYQQGVHALAQQARESGGIAAQPVAVQQATLDALDREIAQKGRSPELDRRREQISRVIASTKADLNSDGLRAGLERGWITDLAPIDQSSPEAFAATIGQRVEQAAAVSYRAGKTVSPLDASEASQLRGMIEALPPKMRSQTIASIADSVGPKAAGAIAQQLNQQDRALALAFATAGSKTTSGRYTSELILKGATALKDGTALKDDKKITGWKATIASHIDGAFPNENMASAAKDAAYYIAAGIAQENGGSASGSDIERAVRIAVGGSVIDRNGKKIPIPAGLDGGDFEDRLRNVPVSDIARQAPGGKVIAGGVEMDAEAFAKSIPGQELIPAGYGRYAVVVRGRPVTNAQGQRIYIKVR